MAKAVLRGASYFLAHTPSMIFRNGTTATTEMVVNPDSDFLKDGPNHRRSFEDVVNYLPNQVYIGNESAAKLKEVAKPWYEADKLLQGASNIGKRGDIMDERDFLALIKVCDQFGLVLLEKDFTEKAKVSLAENPVYTDDLVARLGEGVELSEIEAELEDGGEGLYFEDQLVGAVSRAHDVDVNLSAHVMHENLVAKASGLASALELVHKNNIDPAEVDYIIECSEEAAGDMNQRGGGSFSKSIAELAGFVNATGSDLRGFCAAPAHTLVMASSLVKAGTFKNVVVVAGGCTAKLGMNAKDHIKKGVPIIEDCIAGFACCVSEDDGVSPVFRNDIVGKHDVGTGSAPQKVTGALMVDVLEENGLKITDIQRYSTEMQNSDITVPAGAGDVPEANMKMIGALGVMKGHIEKTDMNDFIHNHGVEGFAPTQGHIPSGAPYLGEAHDELMDPDSGVDRVMIVGKGSLFLGRMTNLFDGISIVIERNDGQGSSDEGGASKEEIKKLVAEQMRDFAQALLADQE